MNIGEIIRATCKNAGLSQQQFAAKYDIPLRTLETWLGGTRKPPKYVDNLLLRCLAIDFPTEPAQVLTVQPATVIKPATVSKQSFGFYSIEW